MLIKPLVSLRLEGEETLKCRSLSLPRAERFNLVSSDHGRTQKCDFSISDWKCHFWANLLQNIKIVSLS